MGIKKVHWWGLDCFSFLGLFWFGIFFFFGGGHILVTDFTFLVSTKICSYKDINRYHHFIGSSIKYELFFFQGALHEY